ncbi:1-acyl-sn-glycerol-3-phosphate acyltransferase [Geomonas sp. RF6]|uniref:lysophospholipid acyltransferase family protein n=1 Tax=Geomonas sp. RF6 TaxID=2897342 RepID=UPI001E649EAA|nr:lysophospholipid acyltransferase family protein [Geomonas sp. RF6]UFS70552.1 1-acyl-sn-glycerol-3-phosphate acyltransferase [Geomonas sp. RF6]
MKVSLLRRFWVTFSARVIGVYAARVNRFRVSGADNIPKSGGVLIASNHISAYDTVFLPWAVLRNHPMQMIWAPAKEELFRNRLMGAVYSSWGAFPVRRGRDIRAGNRIKELLVDHKVMLFPEGTRHKDGQLGKGNRGVGKIIYDSKPVVVPAAISGVNHWPFPAFGAQGSVAFGKPLNFDDLYLLPDCKETHQMIVDRVMGEIATLLGREISDAR